MPITLGSNISSLLAQRRLEEHSSGLSRVYERLASGQRINRPSDDPASLSIASSLDADARVMTQGLRNLSDGISLLQIAEGALRELSSIVMRQSELAEQAANGVYSVRQRRALDTEANALVEEFNRITASTTFNGRSLLDGTFSSLTLQAGYGTQSSLALSIGTELDRGVSDMTYSGASSLADVGLRDVELADVNLDGILDLVTSPATSTGSVYLGNGNGTFRAAITYTSGASAAGNYAKVIVRDQNGDLIPDLVVANGADSTFSVHIGNGNGTFRARVSYAVGGAVYKIVAEDFNGDGIMDLASNLLAGTFGISFGNGNGTFTAFSTYSVTGTSNAVASGDLNGDGRPDIVSVGNLGGTVYVGGGGGVMAPAGNFALPGLPNGHDVSLTDINHDGLLDMVVVGFQVGNLYTFLGNGDATFRAPTIYSAPVTDPYTIEVIDLSGDGIHDIVVGGGNGSSTIGFMLGNADGTFRTSISRPIATNAYGLTVGDINGDGALDIASGQGPILALTIAAPRNVTTMPRLDILTAANARATLDILETTRARVTNELANIGTHQSRIATAQSALSEMRLGYLDAFARITDTDIAEETAEAVRLQILQQAAAAILAQANQQPAIVLTVLNDS